MARIDCITKLSTAIEQRDKESQHALDQLDQFRKLFYRAIEEVFSAVAFKGVKSLEEPKRVKTDDGRHTLCFSWGGHQFICMPCPGVALPPPDEAKLLGELSHTPSARLAIFGHAVGSPESAIPVSDHYIFPDGSWCACGPEPSLYSNLEAKLVSRYALRLLVKLESQFSLVWQTHDEVRLDQIDNTCPCLPRYPVMRVEEDD